jgi:GNAT superfamily N-acetyltransferase
MYTIRLAKKEDTKQIETIRIKARKDGYQGILEPSYLKVIKATRERIQSFAEYISQSELFLVYEDEKNEIHGFINRGKARDENPQYPYEMYSFYVDPIHQRKGIGTQLFTAFQEQIHHQPFYLWALP